MPCPLPSTPGRQLSNGIVLVRPPFRPGISPGMDNKIVQHNLQDHKEWEDVQHINMKGPNNIVLPEEVGGPASGIFIPSPEEFLGAGMAYHIIRTEQLHGRGVRRATRCSAHSASVQLSLRRRRTGQTTEEETHRPMLDTKTFFPMHLSCRRVRSLEQDCVTTKTENLHQHCKSKKLADQTIEQNNRTTFSAPR